jgi:outer membrane protein OmpA-like peptidoglycan-associated protein
MRRTPLYLALSCLLSTSVIAQDAAPSSSGGVNFFGRDGRIGLGVDDEGDFAGDAAWVFRYSGQSAWIGEGWFGRGGAGGLKLNYHWILSGTDPLKALDDPKAVIVAKGFLAVDQNAFEDRKLTIGGGLERNNVFGGLYVSRALTDERAAGRTTNIVRETFSGSDGGRPFTQQRTTTTITDFFEQAYDLGFGARVGRYFERSMVQLQGGVDYERGDDDNDQLSATIGAEKFIVNTPVSIGADVQLLKKDGPLVLDDSDTRAFAYVRYNFGNLYRSTEPEMVDVKVDAAENAAAAAAAQPTVTMVKNTVAIDCDTFFEFDRATLRPEAISELDAFIAKLTQTKAVGPINVSGHTCDIGATEYNQGLSERRAKTVSDYLASKGVDASRLITVGKGELNPTYPNDGRDNRRKNRRVDVEFLSEEEVAQETPATPTDAPVQWRKEPVKVPPAWIERALRGTIDHKRSVDTYRTAVSTTTVVDDPRVFTNRAPVAQNDALTVARDAAATLVDVLANDSDPDGDRLTVASTSTPANGTVTNSGTGVLYQPRAGFSGTDSFTYTVRDPGGLTATATVNITVTAAATNRPPVAVDDSATTRGTTPVSVAVLSNDSDPDGDALRVVSVTTPANGAATFTANGQVSYTARAGFVGTDTFTYTIEDARGARATATVSIVVSADQPANRSPIARPDNAAQIKGGTTILNVLENDEDPDGDPLRVTAVSAPSKGTAEIINNGTQVRYTSLIGVNSGPDLFTYTISDGRGGTATGQISVTIQVLPRP